MSRSHGSCKKEEKCVPKKVHVRKVETCKLKACDADIKDLKVKNFHADCMWKDPIVGTWQIAIFGGAAQSNCNFFADGNIVNQDNATLGTIPNILGNQSAFGTSSFGQWRKIGTNVYEAFFSNLVVENNGTTYPLLGRLPVFATLTMNAAHNQMTADTSAIFYTDPTDATFTGPHGPPLPGPAIFYKTTFATFGM